MRPTRVLAFQGKYRFLSNFIPSQREGKDFSVEHYYASFKALAAGDVPLSKAILLAEKPGEAKRMVEKLPRPTNALVYMEDLVREKFRDPEFAKLLLETGDAELVEGNMWHDTFWGKCTCFSRGHQQTGENNLGKILMRVREEIRNETNKG